MTDLNSFAARQVNDHGLALALAGRFQEALTCFHEAVRLAPSFAEAFANLGLAHQELGDPTHADWAFRQSIRVAPTWAVGHCHLGNFLRKYGRIEQAMQCFQHALTLDPICTLAANGLGMTFQSCGNLTAAIHYYREALRVDPRFALASNGLATALKEVGQIDAAIAQCLETLRLVPNHVFAIYNLSEFAAEGRYDFPPELLASIEARILANVGSDVDRSLLSFALAAVYEARHDYDLAFEHCHRANELRKKSRRFDAEGHRDLVESVVRNFDADYFRTVHGWGHPSQTPIFIVGMPRSGSTLVEQILATDPSIFAAGELGALPIMVERLASPGDNRNLYANRFPLKDAIVTRLFADAFLGRLDHLSKNAANVTIKTLENVLHLGLVATAFPNARIVHCIRDPLDVCVSCYFQNFTSLDFSWDLGDIAAYFRAYEQVVAHWRQTLPIPIHDLRYEDLIRDPETTTRQLFAHCGLEWTPRCLRFFENPGAVQTASSVQVRKPLSSKSIGRWRRFRNHLGPLIAAIGEPEIGHLMDGNRPEDKLGSICRASFS